MSADDHLHPEQVGNYVFARTSTPGSHSTIWSAHRGEYSVASLSVTNAPGEHEEWIYPQATVSVPHPGGGGNLIGREQDFTPEQLAHPGAQVVTPAYDAAWHKQESDPFGRTQSNQGPLFASWRGQPARDKVYSLFATKRHRAVAPLLLGMAQNASFERTGQGLKSPSDLSPHSARMVEHLQGVGAVPEDAPSDVMNEHSWTQPYHDPPTARRPSWSTRGEREVIPRTEVEAGRSTMRAALRRPRKQPRTEQLRLFGGG